jgi:subtilisin family serine protease
MARVAIIDSGYAGTKLKLCPNGHHDFVNPDAEFPKDRDGHGTNVGNIIADGLKDVEYCALVYRIWSKDRLTRLDDFVTAYYLAEANGASVINVSMYGQKPYGPEAFTIHEITERSNIRVFAAAGNDGENLDDLCNAFPACYTIRRLMVVGALCPTRVSNYGRRVDLWYDGTYGDVCATSYATPRALVDYVLHPAYTAMTTKKQSEKRLMHTTNTRILMKSRSASSKSTSPNL